MVGLGHMADDGAMRTEDLCDDLAGNSLPPLQVPGTLFTLAKAERRYLHATFYHSRLSANVRLSTEAAEQKLKENIEGKST